MTHQLWLPARFWGDHSERDLPAGQVLKIAKDSRRVKIECDVPTLAEILDDARHYASPDGPDVEDPWSLGLKLSAQATVRHVEAYLARHPDAQTAVKAALARPWRAS
jgi:hypothetical protein